MFGLRVEPQPPVDRFYDGQGPLTVRALRACASCTRPAIAPAACAWLIERDKRSSRRADAVRRRHALRRLNRPHGSPGGDLRRRCCDRSATCCSAFRTTRVVWSGHGEHDDDRHENGETNPFLMRRSRLTD